jgi:Tol biopolymer transport system component
MNVSGVFRFRCLIYVFLYGLILFYPSTGEAQFYQGYQTTFGKNRVQYNEFLWTFYRFKNFDTYFYLGGKELAEYVGRTADQEIEDIEKLFDYRTNSRLQFMIFNRYSDYLQTNIGLEGDEVTGNTGGLSKVFGNKVLIYFDGNHEHLRHQIRAGVSQVLFQQLMYGGNIKDRLQSAVLLTIPDWYEKGLVAYMAKGWGTAEDNKLKDGIRSGKYNRFSRLMEMDPEFAGQSMWHYIIQTYGQTALANLLYMTRVNRSIDNGFSYVLGANLKRLASNWSTHYRKYYQSEDKGRVIPDGSLVLKRTKPGRIYHQLKVSPDGQRVAFVSNDIGKYRVYLTNLRTGKTKKILKGGYKSSQRKPDLSFPVMAWHPTGQFLTVLKEKKGKIYMEYYTPGKRKPQREQFFYFSKVLDFSYAPNGQEFVLSGIQNGQSDIFVYNVRSRTSENLTEDSFDDLSPSFSADGKEIYFSSNRINDTLGISPGFRDQTGTDLDIFVYNYQKRNPVLKRITQTPLANEIQAQPGDSGKIYFLSDANGIYNRHVAVIDSVISYIDTTEHYRYVVSTEPQTNYSRNIESHHVSQRLNKYGTITFTGGRYRLFTNPMPSNELSGTEGLNNTQWRQFTARKYIGDKRNLVQPKPVTVVKDTSAAPLESQEEKKEDNKGKIDINNYIFQSEFMKPKPKEEKPVSQPPAVTEPTAPIGSSVKEVPADSFMLPKQRNYDIAFATIVFRIQLTRPLPEVHFILIRD